jgi:vacuolar-type H+-ATPase subunit F/Vma7
MAVDTIMGVAEGVSTFMTAGASQAGAQQAAETAAKKASTEAAKKLGNEGMQASLKAVKKIFSSESRKVLYEKAKKAAVEKANNIFKGRVDSFLINNFCSAIYDGVAAKVNNKPSTAVITSSEVVGAFDILGVTSIASTCKNAKADKGLGCAKSWMQAAANFDPTGILTIASAFMYPRCRTSLAEDESMEMDFAEIESEQSGLAKLEDELGDKMNQKCVLFFSGVNYSGKQVELC